MVAHGGPRRARTVGVAGGRARLGRAGHAAVEPPARPPGSRAPAPHDIWTGRCVDAHDDGRAANELMVVRGRCTHGAVDRHGGGDDAAADRVEPAPGGDAQPVGPAHRRHRGGRRRVGRGVARHGRRPVGGARRRATRATGSLLVVVASVAVAVAWQSTAARRMAMARCHRTFAPPLGRTSRRACLRFGVTLGRDCVVSCWAAMAVMAAAGHPLAAVLPLAWLSWRDRRRPHDRPGTGVSDAVLVLVGLVVVVVPGVW